jgi:TolB protein
MTTLLLILAASSSDGTGPTSTPPPTLQAATTTLAPGLILFNSNRTGKHEIHVMNPDGSEVRALTRDARFDSWWPRISPDRRHVLFYRNPKSPRKEDYSKTSLWVMAADGSGTTELRPAGMDGWAMQGHAEWSPDGMQLVMFGGPKGRNPQIYITSNTGQNPRQVTDRPGQNLDPSWSPDGQQIVFVGCPSAICFPSSYEVYTIAAAGDQPAVRRTFDDLRDHDPYFAPDGRSVAWLTQTAGVLAAPPAGSWSIRVARADRPDWSQEGSFQWVINDGSINSYPAWSPDGQRIAFHRLVVGQGRGFGLFTIGPDGAGLKELPRAAGEICEYPCFVPRLVK